MTQRTIALTLCLATAVLAAEQGWYPHEGGLMKYRVNIRFGEEPDTMPDGVSLPSGSGVAAAGAGGFGAVGSSGVWPKANVDKASVAKTSDSIAPNTNFRI